MRSKLFSVLGLIALVFVVPALTSAETEEEVMNRYLGKFEKKQTKKLAWVSGYFSFNRINRDNDYNKFANYESNNFPGADVSWLSDAPAFGLELGMVFSKKFAWSLRGEYWMKMGEQLSGSYYYAPSGTTIDNPESSIKVYGFSTGLEYYIYNAPEITGQLNGLALRAGGHAGIYQASWDLWTDYSNLNLSTSSPEGNNVSFKDNAPGFGLNLGADYPTNFWNMVVGIDFGYVYMNFDKVAWYNSQDQEIVATYEGTPESRVDLNLSGFKGRLQVKRFLSW